jgi:hypothetical protein
VYFDRDTDRNSEAAIEREIVRKLSHFDVELDIRNEAFVHLWYGQRYGRNIDPCTSAEDAIASWPTTASSVGVRSNAGGFTICALYGLSGLLGMVARPSLFG